MITRRKLLAFLGLGGAAAAVASKVEAAPPEPVYGGPNGLQPYADPRAGDMFPMSPMRYVTYEPPISDEERERLLEQLQRIDSAGAHVIRYAGPMLEDMPLFDLNDHRTPADFEHVALFAPEPEPRKLFGTVESIEPDGKAWVRIGVRSR